MSSPWNDQLSVDELKHKLVCASLELQSVKEEMRRSKETVRELIELVKSVCHERDELQRRLMDPPDLESEIIRRLGLGKALPEKGKLVRAVVEAGPLLQSLLVEAVPNWTNPPPLYLLHRGPAGNLEL